MVGDVVLITSYPLTVTMVVRLCTLYMHVPRPPRLVPECVCIWIDEREFFCFAYEVSLANATKMLLAETRTYNLREDIGQTLGQARRSAQEELRPIASCRQLRGAGLFWEGLFLIDFMDPA